MILLLKIQNDGNIYNNKTWTSKSFEYKTKIIGGTPDDTNTLNAETVVSLKYLSKFGDFPICRWLTVK